MADELTNNQERDLSSPSTSSDSSGSARRGASKMAILIAFIAGAFAAWIIISMNLVR